MRGATTYPAWRWILITISIHAPHARSDEIPCKLLHLHRNFNPRSSCEERLAPYDTASIGYYISIHAPHARSDKPFLCYHLVILKISIHAPHARSDFISRVS